MSNPKRTVAIINAAKRCAMDMGQEIALDACGEASFMQRIAVDGCEYEVALTVTVMHTYVIPRDREGWGEVA